MINVVHLSTSLNVGGAERTLVNLVRSCDRSRFRVPVVSMLGQGPLGKELTAAGVQIYGLGMHRGVPSLIGLVRLVRLLRQTKPDILQCWMYHANLLGLIAGKIAGVPHIAWNIRGSDIDFSYYRRLSWWTVFVCARLSGSVDAIVVNSVVGRDVHTGWGYHNARTIVIPNGIKTDHFIPNPTARGSVRAELGLGQDALLIGLIARYDPQKDHLNFLKAASLLHQRERRVHYLLAGERVALENSELSRLVRESGLEEHIHLLGPRRDVPRLTAALDIASSSSGFGEGFSNSIGEAMACSVPCVVTDVGDAADIVGETGIVVPPRNPTALARGFADMINMGPDARKALGERARQRVETRFTFSKMVKAYESLYESIMDGARPQPEHSMRN